MSGWNIAASFDIDMSLSEDGIRGMLGEYEADLHTRMDTGQIAREIRAYTSGVQDCDGQSHASARQAPEDQKYPQRNPAVLGKELRDCLEGSCRPEEGEDLLLQSQGL